ncbi:MAG: AGE family epimerase/isomerase [Bacteroidetes bacterium]|nr:AGE family epimerase/isomerase [Bacteroidota bacterium]
MTNRYAELYKEELVNNILPFWMTYSADRQHGGYFTCLNRDGSVYDTDKFMWLQGREVWCFSHMYNNLEPQNQWLDMAIHGAEFMKKFGRDENGNWYFSLTLDGKPLTQAYNIFSDCFAAMGFSSLDKALPGKGYGAIALQTFENILSRRDNWKGIYNKSFSGTRPLRSFALPMILSNLSIEMEHLIGKQRVDAFMPSLIHDVMEIFYRPEAGLIVENVSGDGSLSNSFEGRLLNPGHAIEAMWFLMDIGQRLGDRSLIERSVSIMLNTLEYGWDKEYGGIYYFMDRLGYPPQQLEWDQKLWWVHAEALVALAKGFVLTGDQRCSRWFEKVHDYTWAHFRDKDYGEWFGYLNRRGEVLTSAKGGKWKGCFHIPRALYQVWNTLR